MAVFPDLLQWVLPLIVSFLSVCVAGYAVVSNKRVSLQRSYFSHKAQAYEAFWKTFARAAHAPHNETLRVELIQAYYCASTYAPVKVRKELHFFVEKILCARAPAEAALLDEVTNDLFESLQEDLKRTWRIR